MDVIQAIATTYKGLRFRSRLEARVAAAFDRNGIEYEYESEAFQLDDVRYLPDFWLPRAHQWIEVKPTYDAISRDKKAQALAKLNVHQVFYVFAQRDEYKQFDNRLCVLSARGQQGFMASAVWTRCPGCNVLQAWRLGCEEYVECCNEWFTAEEWWTGHWSKYEDDHQLGIKLPQYQDGRMLWAQ